MSKIAWKAYEEVHFSDQYILRWVRVGDEYVNTMTKEMMEDLKSVLRQQQAEIEALKAELVRYADALGEERGNKALKNHEIATILTQVLDDCGLLKKENQ